MAADGFGPLAKVEPQPTAGAEHCFSRRFRLRASGRLLRLILGFSRPLASSRSSVFLLPVDPPLNNDQFFGYKSIGTGRW